MVGAGVASWAAVSAMVLSSLYANNTANKTNQYKINKATLTTFEQKVIYKRFVTQVLGHYRHLATWKVATEMPVGFGNALDKL